MMDFDVVNVEIHHNIDLKVVFNVCPYTLVNRTSHK